MHKKLPISLLTRACDGGEVWCAEEGKTWVGGEGVEEEGEHRRSVSMAIDR
jgi:hypothetical protein